MGLRPTPTPSHDRLGGFGVHIEEITADQNREVAKIRGDADAAAIRVWREAIESSPGSKMVLSTDSEFLAPLKGEVRHRE